MPNGVEYELQAQLVLAELEVGVFLFYFFKWNYFCQQRTQAAMHFECIGSNLARLVGDLFVIRLPSTTLRITTS
jgi:hypothetical protein